MHEGWREAFLAALEQFPNVSRACKKAGIARCYAYQTRDAEPDFAARWAEALEASTDDLAEEAYRRACKGTEKPVFHMGQECGAVREFSDTLAIFLLKAHRPDVYRETVKQELGGEYVVKYVNDWRVQDAGDRGPTDHPPALPPPRPAESQGDGPAV